MPTDSILVFYRLFYRQCLRSLVERYTWAPKAGGDGGTRPPESKIQRGRPPRNQDISVTFY